MHIIFNEKLHPKFMKYIHLKTHLLNYYDVIDWFTVDNFLIVNVSVILGRHKIEENSRKRYSYSTNNMFDPEQGFIETYYQQLSPNNQYSGNA